MEQLKLSKWLKSIAIGIGIIGLIIYLIIAPLWGNDLVQGDSARTNWYWPWLTFIWITGIPCFMGLFEFWKICAEIGKDNSFSKENVNSFKRISQLFITDSIVVFIGNVVLFFLNMNYPSIAIIMLFIMFAGITIGVLSAVISHLVLKAYKIKEENELTI